MMQGRICAVGAMLLVGIGLGLGACGGESEPLCEPMTYRCGGLEGEIVERCESSGERWETLTDCSEYGEVCDEGVCIRPDAD